MKLEQLADNYPLDMTVHGAEAVLPTYEELDNRQPYEIESSVSLSINYDASVTTVSDVEITPSSALRGRIQRYVGRAAAILAMTGAAFAGSSLASSEAEAEALRQGPVACHNNDGSTGVRLGELCLVNDRRYDKDGPGADEKFVNFFTGVFNGECETVQYAADGALGWATGKAIKVYKAGKFLRFATPAGLLTTAGSAIVGNRICD